MGLFELWELFKEDRQIVDIDNFNA